MVWRAGRTEEAEELGIRVFDPPLPALRVPLSFAQDGRSDAGDGGGEGGGTSALCFRSERARGEAAEQCQREVSAQCLRGARSSCVLGAVRHCKPGPVQQLRRQLRRLLPGGNSGMAEGSREAADAREACEDAFVRRCTEEAEGKCGKHGVEFCERVYSSCAVMPLSQSSTSP